MLLAIDIGNSTTKVGIFEGEDIADRITIDTQPVRTAEELFRSLEAELPENVTGVAISSVVKEANPVFRRFSQAFLKVDPLFVDHTFDFGFSINYFPPEDCGADRLVDAFSAIQKFGAPCIVCDFGTATTIDVVTKNREYIGGIITPGINTLASALFEKTSKLPRVELRKPDHVIGKSTVGSIESGIYYGYVELVDGIIERILEETRGEPKVVSTGGFADLIAEESQFVELIERDLMLDGLNMLYKRWESKTDS